MDDGQILDEVEAIIDKCPHRSERIVKRFKNGVTRYSGDDIAAAFNRPAPSTPCANCPHRRGDHRRVIVKPGMFDGIEAHYECEEPDGRTKSGDCKCEQFVEREPNVVRTEGEKP